MKHAPMPVQFSIIQAGKLRRYKHFRFVDYITTPGIFLKNSFDIIKTIWGTIQSIWLIIRFRPDVVFAKGGFVCLPVGFAARLLRTPLVIHDSDARPGLTNRLLAPYAKVIATGYPLENYSYNSKKSVYTGVPVRTNYQKTRPEQVKKYKQELGFDSTRLLVVAMGGGLGAKSINQAITHAAPDLIKDKVQLLLLSGVSHYEQVNNVAQRYAPDIQVVDFVSDGMGAVLGAADVVVTRASATTLQELAVLAKPIIAVPSRALADQHKNAEVYEKANAAIVLTDDQLESGDLVSVLKDVLVDKHLRQKLGVAIHALARPHAARDVALLIIDSAKR